MAGRYIISLDVHGQETEIVVMTETGRVTRRERQPTTVPALLEFEECHPRGGEVGHRLEGQSVCRPILEVRHRWWTETSRGASQCGSKPSGGYVGHVENWQRR